MSEQIGFINKHSENTIDRMVTDLFAAIGKTLVDHGIEYNGHKAVKLLGQPDKERLLFDVLNPDGTFDHIEFKVTQTGWGRGT